MAPNGRGASMAKTTQKEASRRGKEPSYSSLWVEMYLLWGVQAKVSNARSYKGGDNSQNSDRTMVVVGQ